MARGFPDFQTPAGRSLGGSSVAAFSFGSDIASGVTASFDLPSIAVGTDRTIQNIGISVPGDAFIHTIVMFPTNTSTIFFKAEFVRNGFWTFSGENHKTGVTVRIQVTNNGDATLNFIGEVFWVERDL